MKMKEFGPPGGGHASLASPLGSANDLGATRIAYLEENKIKFNEDSTVVISNSNFTDLSKTDVIPGL